MEPVLDNIGDVQTTNRLPLLSAFVAVVAAGSYTRAAARSGVDKSLLSRRVKALEASLGVRLLHRTTRSLSPTDAGRLLYDRVAGRLGEVQVALAEAAEPGPVAGRVKVASVPLLAHSLLVPALATLRRDHPDLLVDLRCTETMVNLVEGGFDLAIRAGNLRDSSLIARRIGEFRYAMCASPAWVERNGLPSHPSELVDHWVLYGSVPNAARWRFARGDVGVELRVNPVLVVDNGQVLFEAVRAGLGVGPLAPPVAGRALQSGELVRLVPEWSIESAYGIYGVTSHRDHVPARVQAVLAAMRARMAQLQPEWDALTRPR